MGQPEPPYRAGDGEDFDRLYRATYDRVFRTVYSLSESAAEAEDCTQEAFLRAFRAWKDWNQDAPAEAWLHRVAINVAISQRRRRRLREVGELVRRLGRPEPADPSELALDGPLLSELRRLPTKQAAALVLRHLHGYSNREIALALGINESTVASRLMSAKRALRARLSRSGEDRLDSLDAAADPPSD
ncbi:MAG TPA: sigma-70 family RNA polymerase sigma factor [Candidatus Nitrosotalea sp.]|nr:sigma-70 family RNA polymerase sigma factor [Candidatus Nitrosotalea sp.]